MMTRLHASVWMVAAAAFLLGAPAAPAHASTADAAGKYIDGLGSEALGIISNTAFSKTQKQSKLEGIFSGNVDIPWVGRFVLGHYWKKASEDQRKRYLKHYETFLVKHYTSRFTDYTGGTFTLTGTRDDGQDEYTVSMELASEKSNDPPVLVDYRVRKQGNSFKIFDVIVEGVSLIATQRSEFTSVLTSHDIDYLISQLENRSLPVPTE